MIAISGLPGTGKSTIASDVASQTGCSHLSADIIRKGFFPKGDPGYKYSREVSSMVYEIMYLQAESFLRHKRNVILDGMHYYPLGWDAMLNIAEKTDAVLIFILLTAPVEVLKARIEKRKHDPFGSEADISTLERHQKKLSTTLCTNPFEDPDYNKRKFIFLEYNTESHRITKCNTAVPSFLKKFFKNNYN